MKKNRYMAACMLGIGAVAAMGAAKPAQGAEGWYTNGADWYYAESDGSNAADCWKKSGNDWFYLGPDGKMLTETLITADDGKKYYVDGYGAMVTDAWVSVETEETDREEANDWYYFQSNGKAYMNSSGDGLTKKEIDGKTYAFDEEGRMLYGWVDENGDQISADDETPYENGLYYFNTEHDGSFGAMLSSQWYSVDNLFDAEDYEDQALLWFYFSSSGKKYFAEDEELSIQTINGLKYAFDANGVMRYSWNAFETASTSTASTLSAKYFSDEFSGQLKKNTWIYAVPDEEMDESDYEEENARWFYSGSGGKTTVDQVKTINGKSYLFDVVGRMQYGLQLVDPARATEDGVAMGAYYDVPVDADGEELSLSIDLEEDTAAEVLRKIVAAQNVSDAAKLYYFSASEEDGSRKSGTIQIEFADDIYSMVFSSGGSAKGLNPEGANLVLDGKVYNNGFLQAAGKEIKYAALDAYTSSSLDPDGKKAVVVNTSGSVVKSNQVVTNGDGLYLIVVNGSYVGYSEDYKIAKLVMDKRISSAEALSGLNLGADEEKEKSSYKDDDGNYIMDVSEIESAVHWAEEGPDGEVYFAETELLEH